MPKETQIDYEFYLKTRKIAPSDVKSLIRCCRLERYIYLVVSVFCVLQLAIGFWTGSMVASGLLIVGVLALLILVRSWDIHILKTGQYIGPLVWLRQMVRFTD